MDRHEITEWRVETEFVEDEFGENEHEAREWLAHCEQNPEWDPAWLMKRTVVIETSDWERA